MALDYRCTLQLVLLVLACLADTSFSQRARNRCREDQFVCDDGQCIQYSWQCDGRLDCNDGSDETEEGHCAMTFSNTCHDYQFDCGNGHCIRRTYMCDGDPDCDNEADEEFSLCNPEVPLLECDDHQFTCADHRFCIPLNWKCDGEGDCRDNSDEDPIECGDVMGDCGFGFFNCSAGGCIDINLVCDRRYDCLRDGDHSDEEGCPTERRCSTTEFQCPNREIGCIPLTWVCDGEKDCGDESDEIGCVGVCLINQVQCTTGGCVNSSQLCDDIIDCEDGSDEFTCAHDLPPFKCRREEFRCYDNHQCVSKEWVCDGIVHCLDGSDEHPALCGTGSASGHGESGVGGFDIRGCQFSQCSQHCVEVDSTRDGYFCSCNARSLIDQSNPSSCIDYDECSDPDRCSQVCRNTKGGYICSCADGYVVRPENRSECVAESDYPPAKLLFANRVDIRAVEMNGQNQEIRVKHLRNAIAVDFHYRLGYMFWTDIVQETINRALLNGTEVTTLVSTDLKDPDGLAVDWINDKLYWVDADMAKIEVANLDGSNRTVLFANNIGILRAIVVDPTTRYFFWTDWGENPRIERASMDGTQRTVLHSEHLAWPNGLTLDYTTHTLYWVDAKVLTIESSFIDGSNRRPIRTVGLRHPFALTMFENSLYWSDWQRKSLFTTMKFARSFVRLDGLLFNKTLRFTDLIRENRTYTELANDLYFPMDVKVVHPLRQPEVANPCADNNGGCHYLCLLSATNEQGYSCACPVGISVADDGKSCAQLENFILVTRRDEIFRISLDVPELIDVYLPLTNLSGAGGLDRDDGTDKIYWTDLRQNTINSANSNGTNQTVLIDDNLFSPAGLAVDWLTKKMYWTEDDRVNDRIEVANLDGSDRAIVVLGSDGNPMHKPRDIVVHPVAGLMFWTDWGKYPKIERANLDGSERVAIVTGNLTYPNGLAIDYESSILYWCDAGTNVIEYSDFNGDDRTLLTQDADVPHPFGVTVYQNWIYWTDWSDSSLNRMDRWTGENREVLLSNLNSPPMDIHVYHRNQTRGVNPCAVDNGGCSHHCLSRSSSTVPGQLEASCVCPTGHRMNSDGKTCNRVIDAYVLFPIGQHLREISLDTSDQYLINFNVKLPMFQAASSVAVDIMTDEIYWADRVESKIFKASRGGGTRTTVIGVDLKSPESIAIDWIGRKLYWADSKLRRIEVSNLDGSMRRVLFWRNFVQLTSIAIDLESFHIFWSDAGNVRFGVPGKIERADMDGNNRITIVARNVGTPMYVAVDNPTSLGGRIYWTDAFHGSIETTDFNGGSQYNLITHSDEDRAVPHHIAVEGDYIYWTDIHHNTVNRALKSSGNEQIRLAEGAEPVSSVVVIKKSQLRRRDAGLIAHPCDGTNQGCSHFCLPNPHLAKYSCSCTTGISLLEDGKTCRRIPPLFLLIASRTDVRRISMDPSLNDYNDVSLVTGLPNTLAIDYRLTAIGEGQMIFTDKILGTIYTANFDGSDVRPIFTEITSMEGLAYDWIGKNIYWTDNIRNSLEVVRYNGQHRKVLNDDLLDRPRGIAVDPKRGKLFITDWSYYHPSIIQAQMDGQRYSLVIDTNLKWPNGLSLDRENERIYWIDAYLDKMETSMYDGSDRKVLIQESRWRFHPYDIVYYKGYVFWSSVFNKTMHQAQIKNDMVVNEMILRDEIYGPCQFHMVDPYTPRPGELSPSREHGACAINNGGCDYLCLATGETSRVCACPDDLPDCSDSPIVTTKESVEQTTPTNRPSSPSLPETTAMTTDGETPPPTTPPPIHLVTLSGPRIGDPVMFANGDLSDSDHEGDLSTGIIASMVVVAIFMIIIVVVVILVTAVIIKRQKDRNKRQQRQLESMRRLQFSNASCGKDVQQEEERSGHVKHHFHFHRNSSGSMKRSSTNVANTNVDMEEPEVYPLPPKPQQRRKISTPDSPLLKKPSLSSQKPPAPPPPGTTDKVVVKEEEPPPLPPRSAVTTEGVSVVHVVVPSRATNVADTNVDMEEPEVYQLPPKPQPRRKISTPDSPLLKKPSQKPPAPPPPGTTDKVVVKIIVEDWSMKPLGGEEATPPPRPPKKSMSSLDTGSGTSDTGSSAREQSPLTGRKLNRLNQSKSRESCKRQVHFDPSLPKEEEPPPLPPRSAVTMEGVPVVHVVVPSRATSVGVVPAMGHKGKYPAISSEVITVQTTMENGEGEGAGSTPPPNYSVVMEMEPHGSERSSRDGSHDALSDCTASTELEIGERGEGGVRQGSPESSC